MSRTQRGEREQGHVEEGFYCVQYEGPSLLSWLDEDDGLYPGTMAYHMVQTRRQTGYGNVVAFQYLLDAEELVDFVRYVCPRLQERRELRETTGRSREERERLGQQVATLEAEKEGLQATLKMSEQEVAEATAENERLSGDNTRLRQDIFKAEQGSNEARREANEARVEASSLQKKLAGTETAYEEAKSHFISAPALVSSLRSLTDEVKTLQEKVQTNGERTAEMVVKRPPDGRRSEKTLLQMKRVLHDLGRYPRRRRRAKAADAAEDGRGAIRRGRICYSCRCKGHLAGDCPQKRTASAVESANPISDSDQRVRDPQESTAEASSSGWSVLPLILRRTRTLFAGGVD